MKETSRDHEPANEQARARMSAGDAAQWEEIQRWKEAQISPRRPRVISQRLRSYLMAPLGTIVSVARKVPGGAAVARAVSAVTGVVGSLDADTLARVAQGSAGATGQVTLVLSDGARVRWGDASESALKARVLKVLLSQRASVYDVSSPHAPTTS